MTFHRFSSINFYNNKKKWLRRTDQEDGAQHSEQVCAPVGRLRPFRATKGLSGNGLLRLKASSQTPDRNKIDSAQGGGNSSSNSTTARVFENQIFHSNTKHDYRSKIG